jgi:hypothetical protein
MNKLFVLFLLSIAIISCDGRDRRHKSNAEVLHENKLLNSFSEKVEFVPKEHVQIITDTILSNGFQVKLNYNSIDYNAIIKAKKNTKSKTHYKNFQASIQVLKNGKLINEGLINKQLFQEFGTLSFWDDAIMQFIWIDYDASTENELCLNTSFNIPDTETYKDFILKIDKNGVIQIKEKTYASNLI